MHYYQFNIADYRKDTAHLSLLEHGIYRQLLDSYYLDEKPIETQSVMRRLAIKSEDEKIAFENVLSDFFTLSECGKYYSHARVDAGIAKYKAKAETAKANGAKGGRPKKPKKTQPVNSGIAKESKGKANHKPLTNKPLTNNKDQKIMSSKLDAANEVIGYLNLKSGAQYQPVESNTKFILARFAEGRTVADIKSVIDRQCLEWPPGHTQNKYLRPATLFNAEKFNQYFGQLGQPILPALPQCNSLAGTRRQTKQRSLEEELHDKSWM